MLKRSNIILLLSLFALSLFAGGCIAPGIGVGVKAGTLGVGGEVTTKVLMNVNARFGYNKFDFSTDGEIEDIDYEIDTDLQSFTAFLDWHVFLDAFRVSAGVLSNKNEISLGASPFTAVEIGSITYTPAEVGILKGSVKWDDIAPYFGIGWGDALSSSGRFGFTVDLGVAYTRAADVDLSSSGGTLSADPGFRAALARERRDIEKELGSFKYYPVLCAGLYFRF